MQGTVGIIAGRPVENEGELNLCIPSDFPEYVEPLPQSVADVERSQHNTAWHDAMKIVLDGYKTAGR